MCGFESLLGRHEQIDRMARFSDPLPVELGIGEYLHRLREQVAACGHGYRGGALTAKRLVLLAGDDQHALGVSRSFGHQNVGADIFSSRDDILPLPPYLSKILIEIDLIVATEKRVGPG